MPLNLVSTDIYILQLWMCTSRRLNLHKIQHVDTHVLRDIYYVRRHIGQNCLVGRMYLFVQVLDS